MPPSSPIIENGGYDVGLETVRPRARFCFVAALIFAPWVAFALLGPQEEGLLAQPVVRVAAWVSLGILVVLLTLAGFFRLTEKPRERTVLIPRSPHRF